MILERFIKQPAEVKDYDIDYAEWLDPMGDAIDEVTVSVVCLTDPSDAALVVGPVEATSKKAKLWVSGGTDRQRYKVTVQVVTQGGRVDESELMFSVKDF